MNKYSFYIQDLQINLLSVESFNLCQNTKQHLKSHIPGINFEKIATNKTININNFFNNDFKILFLKDEIIINSSWKKTLPFEFTKLIYFIVRNYLIENNYNLLHSSCLTIDYTNILIAGPSGCGKSSITMELLKNPSVKYLSGDKTILKISDTITPIDGTLPISLRKETIIPKELSITDIQKRSSRTLFNLKSNKLSTNKSPISYIFFINISNNNHFSEISSNSEIVEKFYDPDRSDISLYNQEIIDPSIIISKNIKNSLNNISIIKIDGTIDFISSSIRNTLLNKNAA